jgi:hypothetical protein
VPADVVAPGSLIGGLLLRRCLGKGGMGVVYLADQLNMGRRIAVKILSPSMGSDQFFVKRFVHEALATAKLEHPNIVTIHDAGSDNGFHYLAMEYVDGESLASLLKREGKLSETHALETARSIATALAFAWDRHRMLHRDIKPANIMQTKFGELKLMDLGLAKSAEDPDLTATGMAMGTPLYMSPEQARGEHPLDCRSDMYSLGATIYHMIAGAPPFPGNSAVEILTRHALEPPPPIREKAPEISEPCVHFLDTLLAKKREQRPATWQALIQDIDRVLQGMTPLTPRPGQPSQRQRERRRAEALRLAERAASRMAHRDSPARVAKTLRAERGRRAFFLVAMGTFMVAIAIFSLGVHLQMQRRHERAALESMVPPPVGIDVLPSGDPLLVAPPETALVEDIPSPSPSPSPTPVPEPPAPVPPPEPELPLAAQLPRTPARGMDAETEEFQRPLEQPAPDQPEIRPAEQLADEVFAQLLDSVATELFRGRYDVASATWAERTRNAALAVDPERLAAVRMDLQNALHMPERVLASFLQDRGKRVNVQLRTNKVAILVEGVANGKVHGSTLVAQGEFRQSFTPAELSPKEFQTRLGPENDPAASFLRGLLSVQNQKFKTARECFAASPSDLSAACLRLLNEEDAKRAFVQLLRDLNLPSSFRNPETLAEDIRNAMQDADFQARGRVAAQAFLRDYGTTRTAGLLQDVFVAFGVGPTTDAPPAVAVPRADEVALPQP